MKRSIYLCFIACFILTLPFMSIPAQAAGWVITNPGGTGIDMSSFADGLQTFYDVIKAISLPCAALTIALGAFKMFAGDEKAISKGKTMIYLAITAVIALIILPAAIKIGIDSIGRHAWNPVPTSSPTEPWLGADVEGSGP